METIKIQAKHMVTIFRNDTNGYTVARFRLYDVSDKEFSVTGFFSELEEDALYNLYGNYEEHPRYGMQFKASSYERVMPNDTQSLVRFFSSAQFPGIGKATAMEIVETLGEDALEKIRENGNILDEISSLSKKKKESIIKGVQECEKLDDSIMFFTSNGVSVRNIMRIEAAYGEDALRVVKENPYQLVEDIDGIGFTTADKLAKSLSFEDNHPYRIKAAILSSVLSICMSSGDSYVERVQIERELQKKMKLHIIDLDGYLEELVQDRSLIIEEHRIYHHTQYDAECGIANFLHHFPYVEIEPMPLDIASAVIEVEEHLHITYEARQKEAIHTFFSEPFAILTGGPGTGKTTIVQGILMLYKKFYPTAQIALCAPTGRAAKRLSQLSDGNATTIHSLLKWDLEANTFLKNQQDPIEADLLIVDEFSMVDQWLFYNLLKAAKPLAKILLIGDEDQLPSVGPGCVLKDLIASEALPVIRLEKIFRQSEGSDVVTLAHEIREGHFDILHDAKDVAFFPCLSHEVKDRVLQVVQNAFEKGYRDTDIQVLAPMYGGVAGIDNLNNALQMMINPPDRHKRELRVGYRTFREYDKVLQLKNQPEDEVYNGDIGTIKEIIYASEDIGNTNRIVVAFDDIIVEYSGEQIYNITHAYCISIHKSQGSEYPIVIMPVVNDYRHMLQRRLLYTGITRAKKSLVLLGHAQALQQAIATQERMVRKSTLKMRICSISRIE